MSALPLHTRIGFDYWGCNIGDDLSLFGYLRGLEEVSQKDRILSCTSQFELGPLAKRFSSVRWARAGSVANLFAFAEPNAATALHWTAVGGTPFQSTCGPGLAMKWSSQLPFIERCASRTMVCVGAEAEILANPEPFLPMVGSLDRVSTRDEHSARLLVKGLGLSEHRIEVASDLAHIAMKHLAPKLYRERAWSLGICLAADTLCTEDTVAVRDFALSQVTPVAFLANDVRDIPRHEIRVYKELCQQTQSGGFELKTRLLVPDYEASDASQLLVPVTQCETVLSSRYHVLLAAAWLGCRIGAIGRSSKIAPLATLLGIPCIQPPLTRSKMDALNAEARTVPVELLQAEYQKALQGLRFVLQAEGVSSAL